MKISELVKELNKIKKIEGDINVEVQYRDWGGDYGGTDEIIYLFVERRGKTTLLL